MQLTCHFCDGSLLRTLEWAVRFSEPCLLVGRTLRAWHNCISQPSGICGNNEFVDVDETDFYSGLGRNRLASRFGCVGDCEDDYIDAVPTYRLF